MKPATKMRTASIYALPLLLKLIT